MDAFIFINFAQEFLKASNVCPDQTARSPASELDLHCLQMSQKRGFGIKNDQVPALGFSVQQTIFYAWLRHDLT